MHHDEVIRVSSNIKYSEAYKALVVANLDLFNALKNDFTNKYILRKTPPKWNDCFKCSSLRELKKIVKVTLRIE